MKQKHSFRYPDEENEDDDTNMHLSFINDELKEKESLSSSSMSQGSDELKCSTSILTNEQKDDDGKSLHKDAESDDKQEGASEEKDIGRQVPPNPFLKRISFEDLKEEVKMMPKFPPPDFVRTGSDDSGTGCSGTRPGSRAQTRYEGYFM